MFFKSSTMFRVNIAMAVNDKHGVGYYDGDDVNGDGDNVKVGDGDDDNGDGDDVDVCDGDDDEVYVQQMVSVAGICRLGETW